MQLQKHKIRNTLIPKTTILNKIQTSNETSNIYMYYVTFPVARIFLALQI